VEFETNDELESGIDIVEPSVEHGLVKADENGVARWWFGSPSYAIEWKVISKSYSDQRKAGNFDGEEKICQCGVKTCKAFYNPKRCGNCKSDDFELVDGHLLCNNCHEGSWHE